MEELLELDVCELVGAEVLQPEDPRPPGELHRAQQVLVADDPSKDIYNTLRNIVFKSTVQGQLSCRNPICPSRGWCR